MCSSHICASCLPVLWCLIPFPMISVFLTFFYLVWSRGLGIFGSECDYGAIERNWTVLYFLCGWQCTGSTTTICVIYVLRVIFFEFIFSHFSCVDRQGARLIHNRVHKFRQIIPARPWVRINWSWSKFTQFHTNTFHSTFRHYQCLHWCSPHTTNSHIYNKHHTLLLEMIHRIHDSQYMYRRDTGQISCVRRKSSVHP